MSSTRYQDAVAAILAGPVGPPGDRTPNPQIESLLLHLD